METRCGTLSPHFRVPPPRRRRFREPAPDPDYERIQLGDVRYIYDGAFRLLFSAGCPLGARQLGEDVPETFEPLNIGPVTLREPRLPGYLGTTTVKEFGADVGASAPTTP